MNGENKVKTIRALCMALLLALLLGAPAGAAEFSADLQMSVSQRTMKGKIFVKGVRQRLEFSSPQGKLITLVNLKTGKNVVVMPAAKMYMETPLRSTEGIYGLVKGKKALPPEAKKVASGKKSGYVCDVYEIKNKKGNTVKVWMARGLDYPIFTITSDPNAGQVVSLLKNIKEGKQSDSLFKVPAGYRPMPTGGGSPNRP